MTHPPFSTQIAQQSVVYEHDGVILEGLHSYDQTHAQPRPGILLIHQWTGISEHEIERSAMLAELGYNVFAADIYGQGIRPQPPQAAELATAYRTDRALFRARMLAALEQLKADPRTDPARIAAIGYCFGGTGVLELARAGVALAGLVSFHGGLSALEGMTAEPGKVPTPILVLHGELDPYVPKTEVQVFLEEMNAAQADFQFISYSRAVHSFTHKGAGSDIASGSAYDPVVDRRSWQHMKLFFEEIFGAR